VLLAPGAGEPVVVADFVRFSAAPRFSELVREAAGDRPVWAIDPVTDLAQLPGYVPLEDLADGYADALASEDLADGVTVMGFCTAAALALTLGERLAGAGPAQIVLAQPMWADDAMIESDFAEFRADLRASRWMPGQDADAPVVPHAATGPAALGELTQVLRADLVAVTQAAGLAESGSGFTDLLGRYRAWLGFLLASQAAAGQRTAAAPVAGPPVTVLCWPGDSSAVPGLARGDYQVVTAAPAAGAPAQLTAGSAPPAAGPAAVRLAELAVAQRASRNG
jgi:hypothetical protein